MLHVSLMGRPNVGKSTLFNLLVSDRKVITSSESGTTRDVIRGQAKLFDLYFNLYDMPGYISKPQNPLEQAMMQCFQDTLKQTDLIILIVDGTTGVQPEDKVLAQQAFRVNKPILLVINKKDVKAYETFSFYELGLNASFIEVSAAHRKGLEQLYQDLYAFAQKYAPDAIQHYTIKDEDAMEENLPVESKKESVITIALAGRPNSGKSTLFNAFLENAHSLVSSDYGTTRDAITADYIWNDQCLRFTDTAGMRKTIAKQEPLEQESITQTYHAIRFAQVVLLVIDATQGIDKQDLKIAQHVVENGRILIILFNKMDQVQDPDILCRKVKNRLLHSLPQVRGVPVLFISALKKLQKQDILKQINHSLTVWGKKISTGLLNQWLKDVTSENPPPLHKGNRFRIKYITQKNTHPPTFLLFINKSDQDLPDSYHRYLENQLRTAFSLDGVPIRLRVRKSNNPYTSTTSKHS